MARRGTGETAVAIAEAELSRGAKARRALVRAALDVFGESSLEAATTRQIAKHSGQNIAAITYYFGGKEGLYLAAAERVVEVLQARLGSLFEELEDFLDGEDRNPERCLALFKRYVASLVITDEEILASTRIIVREQTQPTKAFAILYDGVLGRLQRIGARLIAAYAGGDPDSPELIIRFHSLLGMSLAFRLARQTFMRRVGWERLGLAEEAMIKAIIVDQSEMVLRGLRDRKVVTLGRKPRKP